MNFLNASLAHGRFSQMYDFVQQRDNHAQNGLDGIVFDLGVCSTLDQAERGFSFQKDGPLDMRMSQNGIDAYEVVNSASESDIADILYTYGDERASRRIARAIVKARQQAPIERTLQLAEIIHSAMPRQNLDNLISYTIISGIAHLCQSRSPRN